MLETTWRVKNITNLYFHQIPLKVCHLEHDVALGRVHLVERLPRDDDHRGHRHQRRRDPEGQGIAGRVPETFHVLPEDR